MSENTKKILALGVLVALTGAQCQAGQELTSPKKGKRKQGLAPLKKSTLDKQLAESAGRLGDYYTQAMILITQGADVNARDFTGDTALIAAVIHGNSQVVQVLLENKADVNLVGGHRKMTALDFALAQRDFLPSTKKILQALIDAGAAKNADQKTLNKIKAKFAAIEKATAQPMDNR